MISQIVPPSLQSTTLAEYEFFLCATHFLGDGMALHQCANNFFTLLGSGNTQSELITILNNEWHARVGKITDESGVLPRCLEDKLPLPLQPGRFREAAAQVDFQNSQQKLVGGHSFPRKRNGPVKTVVPTVPFDVDCTKRILKNCKVHGVSISSAVFAIANMVWVRMSDSKPELPTMMYSALNLRSYFIPRPLNDSYWFLAVGYYNIILPSFLPRSGDVKGTFWHRAKTVKEQSNHAVKNPLIISRSREMARQRARNARNWAKEDDALEKGLPKPLVQPPPNPVSDRPSAPSTVLIGLSMLGNLDGIYKHSAFSDFELHTLTTGSRQRSGGMLLFGYTFSGKLWLSLGYDKNGIDPDVVEKFWKGVLDGVGEFLDQ